jgi:hypothetical protein
MISARPCCLRNANATEAANRVNAAVIVPNSIRWISYDGIDLAERRQDFPAVSEVERRISYGLDPAHSAPR